MLCFMVLVVMENIQEIIYNMKYNSKQYWNERKNPNKYNHIFNYERDYIPPFVKDAKTVLDFGCGIGRTFPLYQNKEVTGIDFSSIYKDRCDPRMKHLVHDVHSEKLPFEDNHFDAGLLIKVTLHANNKELQTIIKEVGRVCKKVLIIAYGGGAKEKLAYHVFQHNYEAIINKLGFKCLSVNYVNDNQVIIEYTK